MSKIFGLVRNETNVLQIWGSHEIPPHTIGRVPIEVVESIRAHQMKELIVVDDHPDLCPFVRTAHRPWGMRYQESNDV